ncbi:uncharacterized methyltransferase C25B8.09-like [Argonauta hians]
MTSETLVGSVPPLTTTVHSQAVTGFTKDSADHYDNSRPYYTDQTIQEIIDRAQLEQLGEASDDISYDVLELGAGTGLFTRKLYPKLKKPVKYLATDPSAGFLTVLQKQCPDVVTAVSSASSLNLPDNSVRVVVAAQCFHWFANESSLKEIHRVLTPGGMLILVWNRPNMTEPWIEAHVNLLIQFYPPKVPREASEEWKHAFESCDSFKRLFYVQPPGPVLKGSQECVLNYFTSVSVVAALGDTEKEKVKEAFRSLFYQWFPSCSKDAEDDNASRSFPFQTHLYGFGKQ